MTYRSAIEKVRSDLLLQGGGWWKLTHELAATGILSAAGAYETNAAGSRSSLVVSGGEDPPFIRFIVVDKQLRLQARQRATSSGVPALREFVVSSSAFPETLPIIARLRAEQPELTTDQVLGLTASKSKSMLYAGVGVGVLALAGLGYYLLKRRQRS